ncbi:sodium-dependent transporter [Paenactinomyces guangxiensis]|uniref:Sodium-dependent transporter n=1 Tax=Paenactinomyces guangxiensis TaxID=1490290 RepID=A0A7W2A844_9BACL|nr:sodium-dependent transporter [Paenactinomyces guangxiensis]MBA4493774.1 sodium-dependent transporter [Paenactinomyces guangxiensis]MBH8591063.1 sodium-dependent transporter [Paenactinomyces guangxiensis]
MVQKDQWGSRAGFILAAVGSAVGLGNIWRYPYVAYENGGGAFLIPYLVALFTAAIPILLFEYAMGHKSRGSAPWSLHKLSNKLEWIGWWQVLVAFFIVTYYMVIIGWATSYTYFSFGTQWGKDTEAFFLKQYLNTSDNFWSFGGIQWKVLIPVAIIWALAYLVMRRGIKKGIEMANRILIPVLVIMLILITLRAITLPGAAKGLNVLLTPDFSKILDPAVWIAAYGQVFFSLSIGFAIMITYASYLKKDSDLSNSGLIAAFSNSGFEFLAAIAVFGTLGFLAQQQGVAVEEVVSNGIILAFVVFPNIINAFPGLNSLFGALFFGSLIFAGFTSAISLLEPGISAFQQKFRLSRKAAINWVCGGGFLVSVVYTTQSGLSVLDIVDHFINSYGILLSALVSVILVGWFAKQLPSLQSHINSVSDIRIGSWWVITLRFIVPVVLGGVMIQNIIDELTKPYGGYPVGSLATFGYGLVILLILAGFVLQAGSWRGMEPQEKVSKQKGA